MTTKVTINNDPTHQLTNNMQGAAGKIKKLVRLVRRPKRMVKKVGK